MKHAPTFTLPIVELKKEIHQRSINISFDFFVGECRKRDFSYVVFKNSNPKKYRTSVFVLFADEAMIVNPYPEKDEMYFIPHHISYSDIVSMMKKNGYTPEEYWLD